ncbi:hypothetical protein RVV74_000139 [Enterobacter ludwigii]|uniref:hypothetical protein n=1 Tax=Enterobacter ludwigii TaxID=299767 RepID=UPI000588F1C3|nr:hypothetical protein [Enterobacter ludwigii]AOT42606.1 hypothetical protein BH714_04580 [Enterobacter ludwigii]ELK6456783.1 hypothetical protein [Enterobacter ludwigii]KIF85122.1 hypothetical protein QY91_04540 [Enterobacter ludwigii]QWZ66512.1 hypothetical protein I6L66_11880 [Enterobacter ludwigii]
MKDIIKPLMNGEGGLHQSRMYGLMSFSMLKMRMKMQMRNIRIEINGVNRCVKRNRNNVSGDRDASALTLQAAGGHSGKKSVEKVERTGESRSYSCVVSHSNTENVLMAAHYARLNKKGKGHG